MLIYLSLLVIVTLISCSEPDYASTTPDSRSTDADPIVCPELDDSNAVQVDMTADFLLFSHRGVAQAPDHTFEGYDLAIEQGSIYIEQDLYLSYDGHLIISHDDEIADGMRITEMTLEEIREIPRENGEHYLTLDELFERYGNTVNYVIENKFTDDAFTLERQVLELIQAHCLENNVILQSFHVDSLRFYYEQNVDLPLVLLVGARANIDALTDVERYSFADAIAFRSTVLNEENVSRLNQMGIIVLAWFIGETEEERQRILDLGIDGLFTGYTERTFEMLDELND